MNLDNIEENVYNKLCLSCGKTFIGKGQDVYGLCQDCKNNQQYESKVMSDWIVASNNYFLIIKMCIDGRKTPMYHIWSKTSLSDIGIIKWYGAWRKFCFFPIEDTIWDSKCLSNIIEFLDKINKDYREEMKRK